MGRREIATASAAARGSRRRRFRLRDRECPPAASACALSNSPVRTKPTDSANTPSAATSTVGSFFGQDGVFETIAVEMMRASGDDAPILSRAVASRYLAR